MDQIAYAEADFERVHGHARRDDDERGDFEIDRSRIVHSSGFRRLQGKTQLFTPGQSDFFRTRMTHSLEVAQIAKGLALRLGASTDLCEAASLAHDIGHPPFGHRGERVLFEKMRDWGGFEANAQNLRVLGELEEKFEECSAGHSECSSPGLDLTRGVLDAATKYKTAYRPELEKFYYRGDETAEWLLRIGGAEKSFECQIVEYADDIAYAVHDLEDGLHSGLVTSRRAEEFRDEILESASQGCPGTTSDDLGWAIDPVLSVEADPTSARRKTVTSRLIGEFIGKADREELSAADHADTDRYRNRIAVDAVTQQRLAALKALSYTLLIFDERVHTLEVRAGRILGELFDHFAADDALYSYPADFRPRFREALATGELPQRARVACDYISGMTDDYALRTHRRLFGTERSALFDL